MAPRCTGRVRIDEMKISIHRLFLLAVLALAAMWTWAAVMVSKQRHALDVNSRQFLQPEMNRSNREIGREEQAKNSSATSLAGLIEQRRELDHYWSLREEAMLGLMVFGFGSMVTAQIQSALRRRARATVERASEPTAGHLVGEMAQQGRSLVARGKSRRVGVEIEVDGQRGVVVFRNLTFVTAFLGNKRQPVVELPFSELLVLTTGYSRGGAYLNLRTTAGRVFWTDKVQPFGALASLLDDIIERNRTDPVAYRAARAREPLIRTPWYGWLILALGVASIAALSWYYLYRSV